ncbi:hypothetical protein EUGRSUZ_G03265 [Eucalyptus grandis]|uniref:Uncharacterized protein n=2 Tax=Eucalyptus grandis TaxID=71139 RepID=A0ACC3KA92_EUCGR|nr:hypothetical protein EUGRSUZ_G03265 [Eucalyptus grandis]
METQNITEFLHRSNIDEFLLEKLKITYFTNIAVLDDAEDKQYDNPAIETWLDMLKETTYEAEDILDVLATEALRCKLQVGSKNTRNQVRNWNLVPPFRSFDDAIKSKIMEIVDKLEYIAKQKDLLGLKGEGGRKFRITRRMPTTPLLVESRVFGRDDDKEEIIRLLLDSDCERQTSEFSVVPVLGMGGIGKTLLAQFVFNDRRVDEFFDVKAWACVSDQFDMVRITKAILESATQKSWETMNLELLQSSLGQKLSKKKFLVVLDDLWDDNHENWHELMVSLLAGARGSKIMVTTRNEAALSFMNTGAPYRLRELSDDACWSLFSRHAFPNADSGTRHQLEVIGREIVKKCRGVPLAAKSLGSLLGSKLGIDHWQEILHSNLWNLPTRRNSILPALQLSYQHLPANLKRCFAYCSLFPKDYEFDRDKLVLLWMAEGFVQQGEDNKRMEDLGVEYFNNLLSRSFFQESTADKSRYVMHDLINDLAQLVSRKMRLSFEGRSGLQKPTGFSGKARHFSYPRGRYDVYKKFESLMEVEWLRTFLPLSPYETGFCYLSNKVVTDLLPRLRCLRVLSLSGYCITELPNLIGDLKNLRYLNLSHTAIKSLPQSVCTLYNLQTLMLNDCDSLEELPTDLTDLINLHYFDISGSIISCMPSHMSRLRNLHTLPEFVVGPKSGSDIGELRDMVHLHGALTLSRLENVEDAWDARRANLTNKKHLTTLTMEWSSNFELQDENVQITVLEMLQPYSKVKKVDIRSYGGTRFSSWLGDPSFSNMVFLSLTDCRRCMCLPPLAQLSLLKHLCIEGLTAVKSVGVEFYGYALSRGKPFPSLETLIFKDMLEWEEWSCSLDDKGIVTFPSLRELYIERCQNLKGKLPNHLPCLEKLVIHECKLLVSPLPRLPLLRRLDIKGCDALSLGTALDMSSLLSLQIRIIYNRHTSLEYLYISGCYSLTSFPRTGEVIPTSFQQLSIDLCPDLESLPRGIMLRDNVFLKVLEIFDCSSLISFPSGQLPLTLKTLTICSCSNLESVAEILSQDGEMVLESFRVGNCTSLVSLPNGLHKLASLDYLEIERCPSLTYFPEGGLPMANLKRVHIENCENLRALPEQMQNLTALQELCISDCPRIESFPEGGLPIKLVSLEIKDCESISPLADWAFHRLNSLEKLSVTGGCSTLSTFPEWMLPPTLTSLHLERLPNLEFRTNWLQNLTSLEDLRLKDCRKLHSLPVEGLPATLSRLEVSGCPLVEQQCEREWTKIDHIPCILM